jgi:hypothetical protein
MTQSDSIRFQLIQQDEVPKGREGKHKRIVTKILGHLDRLPPGTALKVPLNALPDKKANIRAALNRATRKRGLAVATSSDTHHLCVWKLRSES